MNYGEYQFRAMAEELSADDDRKAQAKAERAESAKAQATTVRLPEWIVSAERSSDDVWLYVRAASLSGGQFITPDKARDLARILVAAANEAEAK